MGLQNEKLIRNETNMDGDKSVHIAKVLQNATNHTGSFYGNDIRTAYQMMLRVLQYESEQQGFDLAATRDVDFNEVRNAELVLRKLGLRHFSSRNSADAFHTPQSYPRPAGETSQSWLRKLHSIR